MHWNITSRKFTDLRKQLLDNRGIKNVEQEKLFINGSISDYEKSLVLKNFSIAQKRILEAIKNKEQIYVYGDYDVDGICASAIVYKALKSLGAEILPFIPDRVSDGYGLSISGLKKIIESNPRTRLIITVDNGIVAYEAARFAKKNNLDLIITDHHIPGENQVEAIAIVHSTELCGTGVAWCLMRELIDQQIAEELLELVAIGTIADSMELVGVNRVLVKEGLVQLNTHPNFGIRSLIGLSGLQLGEIDEKSISHVIAPKINAAGRLGDATVSLRLLCTNNGLRASKYASLLMETNTNRQVLMTKAVNEGLSQINSKDSLHVVWGDDWLPGIVGLVAARIADHTAKPALAISTMTDLARGSARSVDGVNIVELLRQYDDLFAELGGHSGAAGFSLTRENVKTLKARLANLDLKTGQKSLDIETVLKKEELNRSTLDLLDSLKPFGNGNPQPIFVSEKVKIQNVKKIGDGKHLKLFIDGLDAVFFGQGNMFDQLLANPVVDVAYFLELNKFNGRENIQLKIQDIKVNT